MDKRIDFELGDYVYLKTDVEQRLRIVTGIQFRNSGVSYALSFETIESWHYNFEISKEKDILKSLQ